MSVDLHGSTHRAFFVADFEVAVGQQEEVFTAALRHARSANRASRLPRARDHVQL